MIQRITPTDQNKETEGAWTDYMYGNVRLRIARIGEKYTKAIRAAARTLRKAFGELPLDAQNKITIRAMAEHVLVDWEGVPSEEGDAPYSVDNAVELLTIDPDLRDFVAAFAMDQGNYMIEEREGTAGK